MKQIRTFFGACQQTLYFCVIMFVASILFSFNAQAKVAESQRQMFKNAMEAFGHFIDSGEPFTLAEFFSVDSISIPIFLKKTLENIIIVERSLDISLEDQTGVLSFSVELFGQKVMAKLRIGLEYPGPQKKSEVPVKVTSLLNAVHRPFDNDIGTTVDAILPAETTVVRPVMPDFTISDPSSKNQPEVPISKDSTSPIIEEIIKKDKPYIPPTKKRPEIELIVVPDQGVVVPEKVEKDTNMQEKGDSDDLEESKIFDGDSGNDGEDDKGNWYEDDDSDNEDPKQESLVKPQFPSDREKDDEFEHKPQKMPIKEDALEPTLIGGTQVKTKTEKEIKELKDNAILRIKSIEPKFSLLIGLPNSFRFAVIEPRLKILDTVQFHRSALVISQTGYYEPDFNIKVGRGLNLVGNVKIAGPLERLSNLIGQNLTTITVQGLIDPAIFGSRISGIIPGKLRFGKNIRTGGLKLHLYLKEVGITVGIETGLEIKPPKQEDWLEFVGEINVALEKASLEFSMRGMWENVFGIPGPKIGNLKFKATTDYAVAAATEGILTLSGIGLGGELGIGSKSVAVNVYGEISETEDILIDGAVKGGIFLDDIVTFAFDIVEGSAKATQLAGRAVNKDFDINKLQNFRKVVEEKVPKLGFETAHLSISPKVMWFGGKKYDGVEFDLITYLFNKKVTMHMKVDKSGIDALGAVSSIKIGPVKITGAGADKTSDTDDDGPVISLAIKPGDGKAELFLNGKIEAHLFGKDIVSEILADISPLGVHTRFIYDIGMFKTHLELSAKLKEPKDFFVKARMEQDALDTLSILLEEGAKEMVKRANRDLADARAKVKGAYKKVQEAKQKIKELSAKRRTIEAENKASIAKALINIQPEVARYERTKAELKDAVAECKGKAPKEASSDIDEKSAIDQESALDKQKALNELKNAGLNQNQIDAIRYEINRKK